MTTKINSIALALVTMISPLVAGETEKGFYDTPAVPSTSTFSGKAFAASVIQDSDNYQFGGGLSLETELYQNLHGELVGSFFEDEVYHLGANVLYYVPVYQSVSLYALAGGGYDFQADQWTVSTGGGVSVSLTKTTNVFVDGVYNFTPEDSDADGSVTVRAGVGFKF